MVRQARTAGTNSRPDPCDPSWPAVQGSKNLVMDTKYKAESKAHSGGGVKEAGTTVNPSHGGAGVGCEIGVGSEVQWQGHLVGHQMF